MAADIGIMTKVSPGKDKKSLACTMVAKSSEHDEKAFTCVKVERPR